jgi:hypothetical protein
MKPSSLVFRPSSKTKNPARKKILRSGFGFREMCCAQFTRQRQKHQTDGLVYDVGDEQTRKQTSFLSESGKFIAHLGGVVKLFAFVFLGALCIIGERQRNKR